MSAPRCGGGGGIIVDTRERTTTGIARVLTEHGQQTGSGHGWGGREERGQREHLGTKSTKRHMTKMAELYRDQKLGEGKWKPTLWEEAMGDECGRSRLY